MLASDNIFIQLWNAKTYYLEFTSNIQDKQTYGENVESDLNKMIVLSNWIRILNDYYLLIEDDVLPEDSYFSYDQITELMAKIKAMIDLKLPNTNTFLIQSAQFNDEAAWDDSLFFDQNITFS